MTKRRIAILASLVFITALTLAAWPGGAAAQSASPAATGEKLTLRVGVPEEIDGMNPFSSWSSITWESFRLNYNFLTWYDENWDVAPDLAESWTTSPDGLTWTFKIRSGVTWHDGQPLTAADIAFTYNLILDNELDAYTDYLVGVKSITAPDDTTLVISCDKPNAALLALYIPILPEHIWSQVPKDKLDSWRNVPAIGSGPFQVVEMKKSNYVKLVANKSYFGGAPTLDEVLFAIYQTPESMIADYKAGNLDVAYSVPAAQLESMKMGPGWETINAPYIGYNEMGFNCWDSPKSKGNKLLLDWRIRYAMSWAIDREKIVQAAMSGLAQPGSTVIFGASPWHWEPPADQLITYNPEKAKEILDEAGYTDRDGDGVREDASGKKLDFRMTPLTDYPEDVAAAKLISTWLKDVGIKIRLDAMTENAFYDVNWKGDFDIYFWSWGGDIDPGFMLSIFTTNQIHNWSDCYYSNPEFDRLYVEQATAIDPAKRKDLVVQMQQMLYKESPYLILYYGVNLEAWRADKWTGWSAAPRGEGAPVWNFMRDTYIDLKPAAAAATEEEGGTPGWVWALVVAAVVIVVVLVVVMMRRRPQRLEE